MMQDVANKIKELEAERSKYLRQVAELLLVLEDTEKERDEAGAEAKRLKEILQELVKNRNRAMVSEKPTFYFEQMQPFWRQAEQALKEGGGK
jgi:DNA replication initiation complex subunit (GINS family)